jgi:hypothetical protein
MIIVKLMGGMGNQLFQYALGRSLALYHNTEFKMDTSFLLDRTVKAANFVFRDYDLGLFNIKELFASGEEVNTLNKKILKNKKLDRIFKKITGTGSTYFREPHFHFFPGIFKLGDNVYLDGYWQSPKYFARYEQVIRQEFTFKNPVAANTEPMMAAIKNSNAICVNVRRGDFVTSSMHNVMGLEYFKTAEQKIQERVSDPHYFIFSDDIPWCRENLHFTGQVTYVSHEFAGHKFGDYLHLMTRCKHFIIPNSTFAWWAAWLNTSPGKMVIAPAKWFHEPGIDTTDLVPAEWLRI